MARLARIILPGIPHHVTQRGNGRAQTFFCDADYDLYRDLLVEHCLGNNSLRNSVILYTHAEFEDYLGNVGL